MKHLTGQKESSTQSSVMNDASGCTKNDEEEADGRSEKSTAYHCNWREVITQLSSDEGATGIGEHEPRIHGSKCQRRDTN